MGVGELGLEPLVQSLSIANILFKGVEWQRTTVVCPSGFTLLIKFYFT